MTIGLRHQTDVDPRHTPSMGVSGQVRSLRPQELAHASVMGALCAAVAIVAVVLPHAGWLGLLGSVPMGLLAYRYRVRVVITATVAAGVIGFLVVGLSGFSAVALCAFVGGLAGVVKRHRRGVSTVIAASTFAGAVFGAVVVVALAVLTQLRQLMFNAIAAAVHGVATIAAGVPHMQAAARYFASFVAGALNFWQWLVLGFAVVATMGASLIGWWALSRVLQRMGGIPDVHKLDASPDTGPIQPVPVRLDEVRLRYPRTDHDALRAVSLGVLPAEHVAVTGANGAGKTTLMLILAGREPTSGTVERLGAVGLGQPGGTAVVMQHPESQVLGTRVAEHPERKRFRQIVIRAEIERIGLVVLAVLGSQHEHRCPHVLCAHTSQDLISAVTRQHDVEDHDVEAVLDRLEQAVDAITNGHNDEAFGLQAPGESRRQSRLILYEQNSHVGASAG
jgi:MFS family permease